MGAFWAHSSSDNRNGTSSHSGEPCLAASIDLQAFGFMIVISPTSLQFHSSKHPSAPPYHAASLFPSLTSFYSTCQLLSHMLPYPERPTKAFIVPCSACLWFRRYFGSVPLREGYRCVLGFLMLLNGVSCQYSSVQELIGGL